MPRKKKLTLTKGGLVRASTYLMKDDHDKLERVAEGMGLPKADILRMALKKWLRENPVDSDNDR